MLVFCVCVVLAVLADSCLACRIACDLPVFLSAGGDVAVERVYVLRGLQVQVQKVWDAGLWKLVANTQGYNVLECSLRTAAEDVTDVVALIALFQ